MSIRHTFFSPSSSFNLFKNRSFEILIISFMKTKVHVSLYNFFVLSYIIVDFLQLTTRHKYSVACFFAKNNTKIHVIPWKVHLRQLLLEYLLSRHLLQALCFLHILDRIPKSHKNNEKALKLYRYHTFILSSYWTCSSSSMS
jgi:hypothetical protein